YRGDRLDRRGGGSAICIKDNLISEEISLTNISKLDNAIGCELTIDHNFKLAIFSIYSSPSNKIINEDLLFYISEHYKNFIITGDFNAKNKVWYCDKENLSGNLVEEFLTKKNCHILNCSKPTYIRSKSILDLSICSNSILKFFKSHKVLNNSISDHQPTITEFIHMSPKLRTFTTKKINWDVFKSEIVKKIPEVDLNSVEDIEIETKKIINDISDTIEKTSSQKLFFCKAINPIVIPSHLVDLIKLKRTVKRTLNKIKNDYTTRVYNMLCYKIKKEIKSFKSSKLKTEFNDLGNFNQSESKCWKLLKKLDNPNDTNEKTDTIKLKKSDDSSTKNENEIANMFSDSLFEVFKPINHQVIFQENLTTPIPITKSDSISEEEFFSSLKTLNTKASPG
ncbi:RNA-directed DNA polymerase from mobile element jockey-like, partial [Brachionus plicatilis]